VDPARIKEDALGQGGLAGVDMGHDPNIAISIQWRLPGHRRASFLKCDYVCNTTCLSDQKVR
jgi:hypothetical protein